MKRDLEFEVVYPYPPERVWRALTDPNAIAEWLMPNDFQPRLGQRFQFRTKPRRGFDGIVNCEVIEIDPMRRLSYTWAGGGLNTVVIFSLQPVSGGTRLRLEHRGFTGLRGLMVSGILGSGWKKKILREGLPAVLSRIDEYGFVSAATGSRRDC
jgi:uncharacterized protein YndB with AHSA1/START domain